jgi:hypothetical protein
VFAEVAKEVPPITDLPGLWSTKSGSSGVIGGAVAATYFEVRMGSEPGCTSLNRPVRQHIDQTMGLQIHDDRSVGVATAKGTIIQSTLGEGRCWSERGGLLAAEERRR